MAQLVARPLWLVGLLAAALGLALHIYALDTGRLIVVQPLLVTGLLFALPASVLLDRKRPSLPDLCCATLLAVALASFLIAAQPSGGRRLPDADSAAIGIGAGIVCVGLVTVAAYRPRARHRAFLLGMATGIAYGVTAVLIKYCLGLLGSGPVRLLTDWPVYVLVGLGSALMVLNQTAYQAGPLAASLPPMTIIDPIVAIVLGAFAFDEHLAHSAVRVVIEISAFLALAVASTVLARRVASPSSGAVPAGTPAPAERRRER